MKIKHFLGAALIAMSSTVSASAATLLTDAAGELIGATGVNVSGKNYDVVFENGSCDSLYNGCSDSSLVFDSSQAATDAGNALLDQVLVGMFDDTPSLTRYCSSASSCLSRIVYQNGDTATAAQAVVVNLASGSGNFVFTETLDAANTSVIFSDVNFATFSVSQVPLPAGGLLLLSGIGGIAACKRRKKRAA